MPIQFSLRKETLSVVHDDDVLVGGLSTHSRLAQEPRHAQDLLAMLRRIRERQISSGSAARPWDPEQIWQSMLHSCCGRSKGLTSD